MFKYDQIGTGPSIVKQVSGSISYLTYLYLVGATVVVVVVLVVDVVVVVGATQLTHELTASAVVELVLVNCLELVPSDIQKLVGPTYDNSNPHISVILQNVLLSAKKLNPASLAHANAAETPDHPTCCDV
jgi:hypothetical protein